MKLVSKSSLGSIPLWLAEFLDQGVRTTDSPTLAGLSVINASAASVLFKWTNTTGYAELAFQEGITYKGFIGTYGSAYSVPSLRNAFIFTAAANNLGSILFRTKASGVYATHLSISNAGKVNIPGLSASRIVSLDGSKNLVSSDLASWMTGTANRVTVVDDTDGTVTISTPQDNHTGATPTYAGLTLGADGAKVGRSASHCLQFNDLYTEVRFNSQYVTFRYDGGSWQSAEWFCGGPAYNQYSSFVMNRMRGNFATPGINLQGDIGGTIECRVWDGVNQTNTITKIQFEVDGPVASNDTPGAMVFFTTPTGGYQALMSAMRMAITHNGFIGLGTRYPQSFCEVAGDMHVFDKNDVGATKISNGAFTTVPDTAWTWGAGWSHNTTSKYAIHAAGNTAVLEQNAFVTAGKVYQVAFRMAARTAGQVAVSLGGVTTVSGLARDGSSSITFYDDYFIIYIRTTGTGNLQFTPTTDFDGCLDDISVKEVTGGTITSVGVIQSDAGFNVAGAAGVTQAAAAGKVSDVTALAGGIATAQSQTTPIADGAHSLAGITSITTANGRITAMA